MTKQTSPTWVVVTFEGFENTLIGNYVYIGQLSILMVWLQMTSNTVASVSVGLVSTEASIFTLVVHTIIRVYLTPGVNLVLLF